METPKAELISMVDEFYSQVKALIEQGLLTTPEQIDWYRPEAIVKREQKYFRHEQVYKNTVKRLKEKNKALQLEIESLKETNQAKVQQ